MKKILLAAGISLTLCLSVSRAQINPADQLSFRSYEDSLKALSDTLLDSPDGGERQNACFTFIKTLVRALKLPHSFDYPFDSLTRISILYPEDHSFRIFTWVLPGEAGSYRYFGTIQKNNPDHLEMYPLYDHSDYLSHPQDSAYTNEKWFGCLYYNLVTEKSGATSYYTLLGWDGNNYSSHKKIIDVLSFNKQGKPLLGAPVFYFGKLADQNHIMRFILEYKADAAVTLNYDPGLQEIVYDHLQPQDPSTKGIYSTYVPDGTYEGFKWENGKWHYVENIFTTTQKTPPFPDPIDFGKVKKIGPQK